MVIIAGRAAHGAATLLSLAYRGRMQRLSSLVAACHPAPTVAVTFVMSAFAFSLGWRGIPLVLLAVAVLIGQLSVGWSNDAFDAALDARAGRTSKPTVSGAVTARFLWVAAGVALGVSSVLSWWVAGFVGGSFHVFSLAMAWLYNTVLSRTVWSWLPYALAFGAVPPFLTYGLEGTPPALWAVAVFAIIGVSAHVANALPDLDDDRAADVGGLVTRLGRRRAEFLCWALLAVGTAILASVTMSASPAASLVVVTAFAGALLISARSRSRGAAFQALLAVVAVDVVALLLASAMP